VKTIWLDTETGGLDPQKYALLSIALYDPCQGFEFYSKIKPEPGLLIDPQAARINGYNEEDWKDTPREQDVLTYVRNIIYTYDFLGGANVHFDRMFLEAGFKRHGIRKGIPVRTREMQTTVLDAVELGVIQPPRDLKGRVSYSLDSIARALALDNIRLKTGTHGALGDVKLTASVVEKILEKQGKKRKWGPEEL
jgi:DNA polymerase III epsilon subunit-like protein